jgi:hypothetical protein
VRIKVTLATYPRAGTFGREDRCRGVRFNGRPVSEIPDWSGGYARRRVRVSLLRAARFAESRRYLFAALERHPRAARRSALRAAHAARVFSARRPALGRAGKAVLMLELAIYAALALDLSRRRPLRELLSRLGNGMRFFLGVLVAALRVS